VATIRGSPATCHETAIEPQVHAFQTTGVSSSDRLFDFGRDPVQQARGACGRRRAAQQQLPAARRAAVHWQPAPPDRQHEAAARDSDLSADIAALLADMAALSAAGGEASADSSSLCPARSAAGAAAGRGISVTGMPNDAWQ